MSFTLAPGTNCSLSGTTLSAVAVPASCAVTASQAGNGTFAAAPAVQRTYTVDPQPIDGSWGNPDPTAPISLHGSGGSVDIQVIAASPSPFQSGVSLTSLNPGVCSPVSDVPLSGSGQVTGTITVSLLAPGACTLQFTLEGSDPNVVLNNPPDRTYTIDS